MKSFYPLILAVLGTVLALGLTFLVMRTRVASIKPPEGGWRSSLGRVVEKAAEQMKEEATA